MASCGSVASALLERVTYQMSDRQNTQVLHVTSLGVTARLFLGPHFRRLRAAGVSVALACSSDPETRQWCDELDIRHIPVPIRQHISPLADLLAIIRLWRVLRGGRPGLVHAHMSKAGMVGLIAARLAGVPVRIYQNHGMAMLGSRGLRRWVLWTTEWLNSRLASHVLFCGESTRDAALRHGVARRDRATVLGVGSISGIAVDRFSPARRKELREAQRRHWGVADSHLVVGFVGRIVPHKGIATLLEAWRRAPADVREAATLVLIGGLGDAALTEQVKAAERENIGVRYFGWTDDPIACYAGFDLLVLPSWYEGLPYSALEAQSMELPVICTAATGNVDAVVDGETGIHVPVGDAEALATAIAHLVRSPRTRAQLGHQARSRVVRLFRQEDVVERMVEFYRTVGLNIEPGHADSTIQRPE
jgi:glycosyltransferase involved in cell wall biosynthesis